MPQLRRKKAVTQHRLSQARIRTYAADVRPSSGGLLPCLVSLHLLPYCILHQRVQVLVFLSVNLHPLPLLLRGAAYLRRGIVHLVPSTQIELAFALSYQQLTLWCKGEYME